MLTKEIKAAQPRSSRLGANVQTIVASISMTFRPLEGAMLLHRLVKVPDLKFCM